MLDPFKPAKVSDHHVSSEVATKPRCESEAGFQFLIHIVLPEEKVAKD